MKSHSSFNIVSLVVILALITLLVFALFPVRSQARTWVHKSYVESNGRDIYVALIAANMERKPLGLSSVWPMDNPIVKKGVEQDISDANFTNSTDYFWALYDGENLSTQQHDPYVCAFGFSKLAGQGVPAHYGPGRLSPTNNMWTIIKNVRDEMADVIPVLITRNIAAESLGANVTTIADFNKRLYFDSTWDTPFGDNGFILIRKDGGALTVRAKPMTWGVIYENKLFMTSVPGSGTPPLKYLTPDHEVTPSDEAYNSVADDISD
ncbi:MAG: hypothetical protein PHO37_06595 [Kiritimatiellae bacterium]|nr:hypothetical protein [Kiritimatiellia bacterium]